MGETPADWSTEEEVSSGIYNIYPAPKLFLTLVFLVCASYSIELAYFRTYLAAEATSSVTSFVALAISYYFRDNRLIPFTLC